MSESCYIIGSGPTGVSAARSLLDRGVKVTMLDAGVTLEKSKQTALEHTSSQPAESWNREYLDDFRSGIKATAKGIALKLAYGSDFAYRGGEQFISSNGDIGIVPSLAQGGLSNVWGAAMLPYLPEDTTDWPIDIRSLDPHYRAVLELTGLAAHHDQLEKKFPLFVTPHSDLQTGSIIDSLLHDVAAKRDDLAQQKILIGRSRLAIAERNQHGLGCAAC